MLSESDKKTKIDFTTITKGDYSNYPKAGQMVITSTEKWTNFWQRHSSESVPEVDFEKDLVVAVIAGEKLTSGYSVEIVSVDNTDSQVTITVTYGQPKPETVVTKPITNPYHIIQTSKLN